MNYTSIQDKWSVALGADKRVNASSEYKHSLRGGTIFQVHLFKEIL